MYIYEFLLYVEKRSKKVNHSESSFSLKINLNDKTGVQLVRLPVLQKYIEFDRNIYRKHDDHEKYMKWLENDIKVNGIKEPLILALSKKSQRAYLTEGNHRIICLENLGAHWVPLKITYLFLNQDDAKEYFFIPAYLKKFPKNILPEQCGFEVKKLP